MNRTRIATDLVLAMEEASVLPPGDPVRRGLEATLSQRSDAERRRWDSLVAETNALRGAAGAARSPVGLDARLLALPDAPPRRTWLRRAVGALVAAILLVGVTVGARAAWTGHRATVVAALAAANRAHDTHLTVMSPDPAEVERTLTAALPFPVRLPELAPGTHVIGGRPCALAEAPVAYIGLRAGDHECALYLFEADLLGLPAEMERRTRTVRVGDGSAALVDVWCSAGIGFALVSPGAHVLVPK